MGLLAGLRSPFFKEKNKVLFLRRAVVAVLEAAVFAANFIEQAAVEDVFHKGVAHSGLDGITDMQHTIAHEQLLFSR